MKAGYRDEGSWTLLKNVPVKRTQAAWLYAQFVTSKTVDVKKSHVGWTFIRKSTVMHKSFDDPNGDKYGGLIQFFRGPVAEHRRGRRRRSNPRDGAEQPGQGAG